MIRLTNTKYITVNSDATAATSEPQFTSSYDDIDSTSVGITPGLSDGLLSGTSLVTAVPTPSGSLFRNVKYFSVYNSDSVARTITVQLYNGAASRIMIVVALEVEETLIYSDGNGWNVMTTGGIKGGASGVSGYSGVGISGFSGIGTSGYSGVSGFSGTNGGAGTSGYSGVSGFSGTNGAAGTSGYSGVSGWSGVSGFSGTNGSTGATGATGTSGYSGVSGFSGIDGAAGTSGYSGFSGINGAVGTSGYSGVSGFSGTNGAVGTSGYSDVSGWSGVSGFSGTNGATGTSGYSGVSGFSGTNGSTGTTGTSGYSGVSGFSGYSGKSGFSGIYSASCSEYAFNTSTTNADPGSGKLAFDNAAFASITKIYIDTTDRNSNNISLWIASWVSSSSFNKMLIRVSLEGSDTTNFVLLRMSNVVANSGYDTLTVTYVTGAGSMFANNANIIISAEYSGDSGVSGYTGVSGFSGTNGSTGGTGTSGFSGYSGVSGFSGYTGVSGYSGAGVAAVTQSNFAPYTPTFASDSPLLAISTLYIRPMHVPFPLSAATCDLLWNVSFAQTISSNKTMSITYGVGIYSLNGSTLTTVSTATTSLTMFLSSTSFTSTNVDSIYQGNRLLTVPLTLNITAPGNYWYAVGIMGISFSQSNGATTSTGTGNLSPWVIRQMVDAPNMSATNFIYGTIGQSSSADTAVQINPFAGNYSTSTAAFPASLTSGDINNKATDLRNNWIQFRNLPMNT